MKKKFLFSVACAALICVFAMLATACSHKSGVSLLANAALQNGGGSGEIYVAAEGGNIVENGGNTGAKNLIFREESFYSPTYTVFNTDKKAIVYSGKDEPFVLTFSDGTVWAEMFICVVERYAGSFVTFYTPDGALATDVSFGDMLNFDVNTSRYTISVEAKDGDAIDIGGGQRIIKDGESYYLVSERDSAFSRYSSDELAETENYNIYFFPDDSAFVVLDKGSFTGGRTVTVSSVTGSSGSASRNNTIIVLPGDKIAIQEIAMLPANTTKGYDFYQGESMYRLNTYIYDIAKDKTKKAGDIGYVILEADYDKDGGFTSCICSEILGDRSLSDPGLQIFGEDLEVAVDVQSIMPGAVSYEAGAGYVVFKNEERIVVYKGDDCVLDAPLSKLNADCSAITVSGVMVSADGTTVYDADGSKILSLKEVGGEGFLLANYWQNYIYYYTENHYSGDGYIYAYDRISGEREALCKSSNLTEICPGFIVVNGADSYKLYDATTKSVLKEVTSAPNYIGEVSGGYLISYSAYSESGVGYVECFAYLAR